MLQRVLIAALLTSLAVIASAVIAQQATTTPFQLKFDPNGKVPYSAALVKELLADAKAHGDARRGAVVFRTATSACLSCHKVGTQGGEVGPNLSAAGACLPPEEIVEGVFWPNRTVKPDFKAVAVELADGQVLQGIVKDETARELVLQDGQGKLHRIPTKDIEKRREIGSLMPEGLTAAMTAEQRRDLIRYLLDLGKVKGLDDLSHEPAKFAYSREPLRPEDWPNRTYHVNRDRVYDFYTREALHFRSLRPLPLLLPEWPGLDGGRYGHWGNQNDDLWKDNRWNQTDLGSLQCGVFRAGKVTVPRGVCVRLGDKGEMAACFNPDTLQIEALWRGGFVRFSERRFGFIEGIRPDGQLLPTPPPHPALPPRVGEGGRPFVYRGFYRHGARTIFAYRVGSVEMLDAPWVENGKFVREVAPADKHSLAHLTRGGKLQWPQVIATTGSLGAGRPYALDTITPPFKNPWNALLHFGGHDFFADGSAALCTMQGDVWHVEGLDETLKNVRWRRLASGLHQAQGLVIADGSVYVLGRDQITRLVDRNGDGETDFYECFSNAYVTSPAGHDYICGLERDASGNFYTASGNQGLVRVSADGKKAEVLATGFRNPDGLGITPDGKVTVPCSEGEWTPASMICEVTPAPLPTLPPRVGEGRVGGPHFGYGGPRDGKPPALPLAYLPRGLDNSSGGQVYISSAKWGPLQGLRVHLSFGTATHFLLLRDEVEGQAQGAIVPLVGDFNSGVHRGRFHPRDGQLYVSGMAGWGTYSAADGCFQRVRYTGDAVQLPSRFHVHRNGVLVEFTRPLDRKFVEKAEHHFAQCWNYRFSSAYGSREYSPSHYGLPGHDPVFIASAHLLADGRSLFLEMPDLQPVSQLHLNLGIAPLTLPSPPARGEGRVRGARTCDLFLTVHKLDKPFRELPNYRESTRPVAAHPILKDLAFAAKRVPNPWQKPIPKAREVWLVAGKNLTFATPTLRVKAGEAIRLKFMNPDVVPHNWVLVKPGMLKTVGEMANRLIADPDAAARNYVPRADEVLVYTDVVPPQGTTAIHFRVPGERGRYPFLCTFPGHWMVMNGEMVVE
ncbi:MAG: plastocyanin/azurin family copper-binding protein [Gemmataceae bacterium]|nr:plastocyanin/azurin family copper-binding protein [Gemmataceae bacterium]